MKKIINNALIIISAIALILSLKYSAAPVLPFLPDFLKKIFVTTDEMQQEYVLIYDISVGFLLSALFYFIVDEIPEKIRLHRAKKLLSSQVNILLYQMETIISLVLSKYNRTTDIDSLTEKDFLILNGDTSTPSETISFCTESFYNTGQRRSGIRALDTLNKIIKSSIKTILECTAYIRDYEYLYSAKIELMECIRNIENCDLIRLYRQDEKSTNPCFLYANSSKAMEIFVKLYKDLKKANFNTEYSETILDSLETTQKYQKDVASQKLIGQVVSFQQKRHEHLVSNPVVIISGSKYSTKIIVEKLQPEFEADYIDIEKVSLAKIENYAYIIAIVDDMIFDKIKRMVMTMDTTHQIILISEKVFFSRNYRKKLSAWSNCRIIEEFEFKSIKKIKYTHLFLNKTEPSAHTIGEIEQQIENIILGEVKLKFDENYL